MAITIGELRGILTLQDQFSKPINNAARQMDRFNKSFGAVTKFAALATGAITAAAGAVVALGIHGSKVEGIKSSFEALSRAAGESADVMLGSMRAATSGLVSDFDLMTAANKAMLLGLPVTAESMGTMAKAATVLGRAMNQDATKSLDDLTTALGRSSPLILDNLGLTVKVGEANEAYARTLGKTSSELTDAQKKTAFYNASMEAAKVKLDELGDLQLSFGLRVQQAKKMVTNFVDSLSLAVATSPVVAAGMDSIMGAIQGAFGGDQQKTVTKLMGFVNDFAIGLTYVGQIGLAAATVMVTAWAAIKTVVLALTTVIVAQATAIVAFVAGLAEMGTKIPGIGGKLRGFAEGADALATAMQDVTMGMAAQTVESAKAVAGNSEVQRTIDAMGGALISARGSMEAAKNAQVEATAAVREFGKATGEVAARAPEDAQKILDANKKLQEELALIGRVGIDRQLMELDFARAKELEGLKNLKDLTLTERETMTAGIEDKYKRLGEAAKASSDEILETTRRLEEELALAKTTGLEQQLLQIEFAREKELEGLTHLRERYGEDYGQLVVMANEKYALLTAYAIGYGLTVEQLAAQAGFKSREELERTAAKAIETYQRMLASGEYTTDTLKKAFEAAEEAKRTAAGDTQKFLMSSDDAWLAGTQQVLGVLGEHHKEAAIAGAIIATLAAIAKALASAPFPASLALAAGAAAVGYANVAKIRSSKPGYAAGTPETRFQDFGRVTTVDLHGPEAVVTKAQGQSLAAMLRESVEGAGSGPETRQPGETNVNLNVVLGPLQTHETVEQTTDYLVGRVQSVLAANLAELVAAGRA